MKRSITIPSKLSALASVRDEIKNFIGDTLEERERGRIILAIDEAVANIIVHGYKNDENNTIDIEMESGPESLTFTISDMANEFDPGTLVPADINDYYENGLSSGLGVDVYRKILNVRHEKKAGGGNRLIFVKERI